MAESEASTAKVVIDGITETVRYSPVSGNYFPALGVRPILGRVFEPDIDTEPGRHPEAVISYGFWQRRFHLDPGVLGRTILYASGLFQIIGVTSPELDIALADGAKGEAWTGLGTRELTRLYHDSRGRLN